MKPYATYEQIVNMGGCRPEDLDELGYEMTPAEFIKFVESLAMVATNFINRYCNRKTFEITEVTNEMHTLDIGDSFTPIYGMVRGYPGLTYSINLYDYTTDLSKFTIIPREQPVVKINSLKINTAWSNAAPHFEEITQWTMDNDGDYKVIERYKTTKVTLMKRFPCPSNDNIALSYTYGYPEDDPVWDSLALACSMICANIMRHKKKNQEAFTIRGSGISSYETMFGGDIITPDIEIILDQYVKDPLASFTGN